VDGSFSDYRNSALRDQFKVSGTCLKERMIMIITNPIVSNIREAIKAKSCGDKPTCRNCDQMYVWIVLFPPWTSVVRIVSLNEMIAEKAQRRSTPATRKEVRRPETPAIG